MTSNTTSGKPDRKYQIEYWVRSNLASHEGKPFVFRAAEAEVTLLLPPARTKIDGFTARVIFRAMALGEAEIATENALTKVLDFISYKMKVYSLIERRVRSQVEGTGSMRHCALYWTKKQEGIGILTENQVAEVQSLLASNPPRDIQRALYWRRWSCMARTVPEAFFFIWMALERLAGEEERVATCSTCQQQVICPTHGPHKYRNVTRESIKALLDRHDVSLSKEVLNLRNPLVHGSLEYTSAQRGIMLGALPALQSVVDQELLVRLQMQEAENNPPTYETQLIFVHCQYQTSSPDDAFPRDCPTANEVQEYQQRLPQGGQPPKHMTFQQWPPDW